MSALPLPSPRRCLRLLCSRTATLLVERPQGAEALREPTDGAVSTRAVPALVVPPTFHGASRERDSVAAALDWIELPRERVPSDVEGDRELRRSSGLPVELKRPDDVDGSELEREVIEGRTTWRSTPRDPAGELRAVARLWIGLDRLRPEVDGRETDGLAGRAVRAGDLESVEERLVRPAWIDDPLVDGRETLLDRTVDGREKLRVLPMDLPLEIDLALPPRLKPEEPRLTPEDPRLKPPDPPPDRPRIWASRGSTRRSPNAQAHSIIPMAESRPRGCPRLFSGLISGRVTPDPPVRNPAPIKKLLAVTATRRNRVRLGDNVADHLTN